MPPVPALPVKLTVPADEAPPITVDGLTVTMASTAGLTVNVADPESPFNVAVIFADV